MSERRSYATRSAIWATLFTVVLGGLIVLGSRNLAHFDAALVGYTFATLFATFGITYRYAMWLQRPPTRMYWRQGWRAFLSPRRLPKNLARLARRAVVEVGANRFIFRRGWLRGDRNGGTYRGGEPFVPVDTTTLRPLSRRSTPPASASKSSASAPLRARTPFSRRWLRLAAGVFCRQTTPPPSLRHFVQRPRRWPGRFGWYSRFRPA